MTLPNLSEWKILVLNIFTYIFMTIEVKNIFSIILLFLSIILTTLKCIDVYKSIKQKNKNESDK